MIIDQIFYNTCNEEGMCDWNIVIKKSKIMLFIGEIFWNLKPFYIKISKEYLDLI